jgi:hypothetical protein
MRYALYIGFPAGKSPFTVRNANGISAVMRVWPKAMVPRVIELTANTIRRFAMVFNLGPPSRLMLPYSARNWPSFLQAWRNDNKGTERVGGVVSEPDGSFGMNVSVQPCYDADGDALQASALTNVLKPLRGYPGVTY